MCYRNRRLLICINYLLFSVLGAGILRVSAAGGLQAGSVQLANVHELRAEMRYLTNLRNLCEMFRYPSPENPGGRRGRWEIRVGSFRILKFQEGT